MRSGRTIAGERERVESDSQRERVRKRAKKRKVLSVCLVLILVIVFSWLGFLGVKNFLETINMKEAETEEKYAPTVEVINEDDGEKVSGRMFEYIGQIEKDLEDSGRKMTKAILPVGMAREVDLYIEGFPGYIKVSIDRGTAVSAEDVDRMLDYLEEKGITAQYVDVRVEGKGYYK